MYSLNQLGQAIISKLYPPIKKGFGGTLFSRTLEFPKEHLDIGSPASSGICESPHKEGEPSYRAWREYFVWGMKLGLAKVHFEKGESLLSQR